MTIFDLAKILRFDDQQLSDLKKDYETADNEKKVETIDIMWKGYFELYEKLCNLRYDQFLEEVAQGKRNLTNDLYLQAKKAVTKDFEEILAGKPEETQQINQLRDRLKSFTGATI